MHALATRSAVRTDKTGAGLRRRGGNAIANFILPSVERGRIPPELQAKCQRRKSEALQRLGALRDATVLVSCSDLKLYVKFPFTAR
jgi:hypothetical protein